jgi:hypothetical protein
MILRIPTKCFISVSCHTLAQRRSLHPKKNDGVAASLRLSRPFPDFIDVFGRQTQGGIRGEQSVFSLNPFGQCSFLAVSEYSPSLCSSRDIGPPREVMEPMAISRSTRSKRHAESLADVNWVFTSPAVEMSEGGMNEPFSIRRRVAITRSAMAFNAGLACWHSGIGGVVIRSPCQNPRRPEALKNSYRTGLRGMGRRY